MRLAGMAVPLDWPGGTLTLAYVAQESSLADLFASLRPELENASSGEDGRGVPPVSLRRISEGGKHFRLVYHFIKFQGKSFDGQCW